MKQNFLLLFFLLTPIIFSQTTNSKIERKLAIKLEESVDEEFLVWVYFLNKGKNLDDNKEHLKSSLNKKCLSRRLKVQIDSDVIDYSDFPINTAYLEALRKNGVKIKQKSKWLNAVSLFATQKTLNKIEELEFVRKITEVKKYKHKKLIDKTIEKNNYEQSALSLNNSYSLDYGSSLTQNEVINTAAVHNLGYSGEGILICIMDAGFDQLSHEAFENLNIIDAWDFVNNDADVEDGSDEGEGSHGTATLSLLGGFKEGKLIGTAYGADYILAKTENTDSETPLEEDNWIAAAEWAENLGADIFSSSLGYLDFDNSADNYTYADMDGNTAAITIAADIAVKKGIVVFNSAGNNGSNSTRNTLSAPADGDSVIAIGAVYSDGTRVSFSSVGPTADGRIKPDFMAMGSGTYAAGNSYDTHYKSFSGTSAACPLAAGVAALLLEKDYSLTPIEIREMLRNTSSNSIVPNKFYGWGIIDALTAIQEIPEIELQLKIMLEGAYDSLTSVMETEISSQVPLQSPYPVNSRRIKSIPSNIVDWVLVELRETFDGPAINSKSFLLHKDGRIMADDGVNSIIKFPAPQGNYYVVIKHRNHVSIMSSEKLLLTN